MQLQGKDVQSKKNTKHLPDYKKNRYSYLSIFMIIIPFIPFSPLFVVPFLFYLTKKRGKPRELFHFVQSGDVFKKIINQKIVLSLAGSKLHAGSEMNPFLGKRGKDEDKCFYVLVIDDVNDIDKFEPIVNLPRMLHVYKWWKHLRAEYTFKKIKDFSFENKGDCFIERKSIGGVEYDFHVAYIKCLKPLENRLFIQKAQKLCFYLGEIFLTILLFYIPWAIITVSAYHYFFDLNLLRFLYEVFNFAWFIFLNFYFVAFVVLIVFMHRYLRNGVIKSREKPVHWGDI